MTLQAQGAAAQPAAPVGPPQPAQGARAMWRALVSRPSVVASLIFMALVVLMAIFAPLLTQISGYDPYQFNPDAVHPNGMPKGTLGGISADHWFGVEPLNGRDLFARVVYGARVSLSIAAMATIASMVVGVVLGTLAGFLGGWVDQVISRVMDFLMAFPQLIFMIAIISALPDANRTLMLVTVLAVFGWPRIGRVIRAQTMSLRQREFVEAARASGAKQWTIVAKEVMPNLTGTIVVYSSLTLPSYIATEAGLSFLGVGVRPPTASWGQMISSAVGWYQTNPMFFVIPGLFLTLTVLASMVIGDQLERILNRREMG